MKLFVIFLSLFLWTEMPQAAVIKQNEPFMELEVKSADNPFDPNGDQNEEQRQKSQNNSPKQGEPLNEMDFYNAKRFNASIHNRKADGDLMLKAGLFEGDIAGANIKNMLKNAMREVKTRWPNATVPYVISDSFDSEARTMIAKGLLEYHTKTCIRFVPRTSGQKDYVNFMEGQGCHSNLGRTGGKQDVSLGEGCVVMHGIVHELMHALGFAHEHNRPDRDDYVTIAWDNIHKGGESSFGKYNWSQIEDLGEPYDYTSVMHYDAYSMAVDRSKPVIIPKEKDKLKIIGNGESFSEGDIKKINKLYKCPKNVTKGEIDGDCADGDGWCAESEKKGDCDTYSAWMRTSCMKACGMCGSECKDHNKFCPAWSGQGLCESYPEYMKRFCKKSCKVCA